MKALWKCEPVKDSSTDPTITMIMEFDDAEFLKRQGYMVFKDFLAPNSCWVRGPNRVDRYEMMLNDGSLLVIGEGFF